MRTDVLKKLLSLNYLVYDCNEKCESNLDNKIIARLLKSFLSYGFILNKQSVNETKSYSLSELKNFYNFSIELFKKVKGNNVKHIVFYKNFPQLRNLTKEDYIINAILHYLTADVDTMGYIPQQDEKKRKNLEQQMAKASTVKLISSKEGYKILKDYYEVLLQGNKLISDAEFRIINELIELNIKFDVTKIPMRYNLIQYLTAYIYSTDYKIGDRLASIDLYSLNTVNDILKLYASISGYKVLSKQVIFISLDRRARRILLSKLNSLINNEYIIDDFARYEVLWKKALRLLHVGEYQKEYPLIYKYATLLRNGEYITYFAKIEKCFKNKDVEVFNLLKVKPGYFLRMLDRIICLNIYPVDNILNEFKKVIGNISIPTLLSGYEHFLNRDEITEKRYIMFRNKTIYYAFKEKETRKHLDAISLSKILQIFKEELINRYIGFTRMENVYLDEAMKKYTLPLNNLGASSGFNTLSFGSKVQLDPKEHTYLRFFTHWKNLKDERVDIDLSIVLYDENLEYIEALAWFDMPSGRKYDSYHSGDIVSAPNGASEFIDLNYKKASKYSRYAVVCNNIYSGGHPYKDIPECFSGVMFRTQKGRKGEIFDPKTVVTKYDLTCEGSNFQIAFIIDLKTLTLYWCDIPAPSSDVAAENDLSPYIFHVLKKHLTIYDLVSLHQGHISFVNKEKCEHVIDESFNSIINPLHLDDIVKWIG